MPSGDPGPFQLTDGGGSLRAAANGSTIEVNRLSEISAALVGNGTRGITKTGDFELLLNGNKNGAFDAEFTVADGTLIVSTDTALGTGGFFTGKKTTIADGATLQLRGSGVTVNEHLHINGSGHKGNGAIEVNVGDHTLTERIAIRSDAVIDVAADASLTFGGTQGRFFHLDGQPAGLTQSGDGMVIYDNVSDIKALVVKDGVAAGSGGINGMISIGDGAELRPGDDASRAAIDVFETGDLALADGSMLTLDIDPRANLFDQLDVSGAIDLNGELNLNLLSAPSLGQSFLIVNNDLSDVINGEFGNTNQLSATSDGESYLFSVDYASGSGNDVSLTAISAIPEPGAASDVGSGHDGPTSIP